MFLQGKKGGSIVRDPCKENMEDLIVEWDIIGTKLRTEKFTWSNRRVGTNHISTGLDKFNVHSGILLENLGIHSNIVQ